MQGVAMKYFIGKTSRWFYYVISAYSLSYAVSFPIALAGSTATVTLGNLNVTYDGMQKAATCNTTPSGLATSISYNDLGSGVGLKNAGSYGVTCTVTDAGYSGSSSGTLVINQLSSVTWAGGSSGNWSNASNWAGGALPDGSNVLAVTIPVGINVIYDNAASNTALDTLTIAGNLVLVGNNLSIGSYNQTAGTLTGSGNLIVTNSFNQFGGMISLSGAAIANITQAAGNLSIASLSAPTVNLTSSTGSILGLLTAGSAQLTATTGIGNVSAPFQLVATNLTATTISGGINLNNTPTSAVTLVDFTTGDASAVTYVQNGQDLTLAGTMSSAGGAVTINPPVNFSMSNTAQISSSGGAINVLATGNIVLTSVYAGSGAISLNAGGNVAAAPGFTGSSLIGGVTTVNIGGNATFSTLVQSLGGIVSGSLAVSDLGGTAFTGITGAPIVAVQQVIQVAVLSLSEVQQLIQTATGATVSFSPNVLTIGGAITATISGNAANSGLAFNFLSLTPDICSVNGNTINNITTGSCNIAVIETLNNTNIAGFVFNAGTTVNLTSGWNLVGNSVNTPLAVSTVFGNATNVSTVWKWVPATGTWAFYSPTLGDGGRAYAASKGYDFLTTINAGEGFWVNASTNFTAQFPTGTSITTSYFKPQTDTTQNKLLTGWNLIATGDSVTPSLFNRGLSLTTPGSGVTPLNITTLWAWDSTLSNWYFYSPSMEDQGGTKLTNYITSKSYLDFTARSKTLDSTTGFWVNKP
jgi:hypothetical protein